MQSSNDLQHSGVLGMKWGIRRYQNKDGTLTEEGKQRYAKKYPYQDAETGSLNERGQRDFMKAAKKGKLDYKRLSDKELDMINNRFNKEKQFQRNVEEFEKSTFKYKAKEALITRIKGGKGGGGGDGKKGGNNGILKSLFVAPVEKAIKDAFNFKDSGGGGGEGKSKGGNEDNANSTMKLLNNLANVNKEKQLQLARSGRAILGDAVYDQRSRDIAAQRKRISDMRKEEQLNERAAKSGIIIAHNDELTHYGIKGQKWGIRRFQNEDRTWTAAGKERYGDSDGSSQSGSASSRDTMNNYDKLDHEAKKKAGNALLARMDEISNWFDDPNNYSNGSPEKAEKWEEKQKEWDDIDNFIFDQVKAKSGTFWNNESVSEGHKAASKEILDAQQAWKNRIDELGPKIQATTNFKKRVKLLTEDPGIKEARKRENQAREKLISTALQDIGFEDSERNRKIFYRYCFD